MNDCLKNIKSNSLLYTHLEKISPLADDVQSIRFRKGQQFIAEGTPSNGLFFITEGTAKIFQTGIFGREQIIRIAQDGEMIGYRGFGGEKRYPISAVAITDITLCHFNNSTLLTIIKEIPELTYDLMNFYSEELNRSETKVRKFAQMTVREKVIDTLLYINRKFGTTEEGFFNLQLLRREIADFAGTTEEQVIRVISSLKKEKLLKAKGKQLGITNIELLKKEIDEHNFFLNS